MFQITELQKKELKGEKKYVENVQDEKLWHKQRCPMAKVRILFVDFWDVRNIALHKLANGQFGP